MNNFSDVIGFRSGLDQDTKEMFFDNKSELDRYLIRVKIVGCDIKVEKLTHPNSYWPGKIKLVITRKKRL